MSSAWKREGEEEGVRNYFTHSTYRTRSRDEARDPTAAEPDLAH